MLGSAIMVSGPGPNHSLTVEKEHDFPIRIHIGKTGTWPSSTENITMEVTLHTCW